MTIDQAQANYNAAKAANEAAQSASQSAVTAANAAQQFATVTLPTMQKQALQKAVADFYDLQNLEVVAIQNAQAKKAALSQAGADLKAAIDADQTSGAVEQV